MLLIGKYIIEDLEAEMIGKPKETSNIDNVDLAEEANVDEDTTTEAKAFDEM